MPGLATTILQLFFLFTAMARRPREQRQSPIPSLPWALAPLLLSDEESGPKLLLT